MERFDQAGKTQNEIERGYGLALSPLPKKLGPPSPQSATAKPDLFFCGTNNYDNYITKFIEEDPQKDMCGARWNSSLLKIHREAFGAGPSLPCLAATDSTW
jgi:hypothetical protein